MYSQSSTLISPNEDPKTPIIQCQEPLDYFASHAINFEYVQNVQKIHLASLVSNPKGTSLIPKHVPPAPASMNRPFQKLSEVKVKSEKWKWEVKAESKSLHPPITVDEEGIGACASYEDNPTGLCSCCKGANGVTAHLDIQWVFGQFALLTL